MDFDSSWKREMWIGDLWLLQIKKIYNSGLIKKSTAPSLIYALHRGEWAYINLLLPYVTEVNYGEWTCATDNYEVLEKIIATYGITNRDEASVMIDKLALTSSQMLSRLLSSEYMTHTEVSALFTKYTLYIKQHDIMKVSEFFQIIGSTCPTIEYIKLYSELLQSIQKGRDMFLYYSFHRAVGPIINGNVFTRIPLLLIAIEANNQVTAHYLIEKHDPLYSVGRGTFTMLELAKIIIQKNRPEILDMFLEKSRYYVNIREILEYIVGLNNPGLLSIIQKYLITPDY